MNRRQFCTHAMAVGLMGNSLSACTVKMWELANQPDSKITSYQDEIKAFYLAQDQASFVILSEQYHYIFDNRAVAKLLASPLRKHYLVNINQMYMPLSKTGKALIDGRLAFAVRISDLTAEELQQAQALGFHSTHSRDSWQSNMLFDKWHIPRSQAEAFLVTDHKINGQRYLPQAGVDYADKHRFYHQYIVDVTQNLGEKSNAGKKVGAALLTPITVLSDGVLMLLGLPLLPILLPMFKASAGHGIGP